MCTEGEQKRFPWGLGYTGTNRIDPRRWSCQHHKPSTPKIVPQNIPHFGETLLRDITEDNDHQSASRGENKDFTSLEKKLEL